MAPGIIDTDIHTSGGEPEEVAKALVCLLSEEASDTTGATIAVAGGR